CEVPPMPLDERLKEVLERWARAQAEGRAVDPTELCAGCPELLPQVEQLGRFDQRMNQLLSEMLSPGTLAPGEAPMPCSVQAFPTVPGYVILRQLAEGGMGRVYHARNIGLDCDVALKVIRPEKLSADLEARFLDEARAVARLDHPNIVRIYEVGNYTAPGGG